jgi:hypothetical protein
MLLKQIQTMKFKTTRNVLRLNKYMLKAKKHETVFQQKQNKISSKHR